MEETRIVMVPAEDIENLRESIVAMSNGLIRQEKLLRDFGLHEDRAQVELRASHALRTMEKLTSLDPISIPAGTPIGECRG